MSLEELYYEKIEIANNDERIRQFTFMFEANLYLVQWFKNKWSEPVKIKML